MKTIVHTTTLFYYDGPQVFEARDAIGGRYIAVMTMPRAGRDQYVLAGVEPERLRQFRMGTLDLRTLLTDRSESDWYLASPSGGLDAPLRLEPQGGALASSPHLPEPGFLLHNHVATAETLREARARDNLVLEVTVEPPEAATEHRIHVETLVGLLSHMQTMVKHAYAAALRLLSSASRAGIDGTNAHLLDVVVPATDGSFRIVMEASRTLDLLGHSELARALERVDAIFDNVGDPQKALVNIKTHRGHLAGAYLRLLKFLATNKIGMQYTWAEPLATDSRSRAISETEVGPLVDALSSVSNVGAETVVLSGALEKADRKSGAWRIATAEGEKSGTVKEGGPSLGGLKIGNTYRFTCLEEIGETQSGREQHDLYLTEYEPA